MDSGDTVEYTLTGIGWHRATIVDIKDNKYLVKRSNSDITHWVTAAQIRPTADTILKHTRIPNVLDNFGPAKWNSPVSENDDYLATTGIEED